MNAELESKARTHRALRDAQITPAYHIDTAGLALDVHDQFKAAGLLSPRQIEIVSHDATALAQAIAEGQYSSVEVIEAYSFSAAIAQQTTNCLAWFAPREALEQARRLDDHLSIKGQPVGRLHGVPVSVKDFIMVKGYPQSSGFLSRAGYVPATDAHIVRILREAGAVFLTKTTNPQSIMQLETVSFLGRTVCPYNRNLTCGGSSGGEGALIACRGSPLGVSTDIGGSTRIPASNNGLWGFKPTSIRLPQSGLKGVMPGAAGISGSIGPIARSLRDLELFLKVVLDSKPWVDDVTLPPLAWSTSRSTISWNTGVRQRLRIGVMRDDGVVRPLAPVRVTLAEMEHRLGKLSNVELVAFETDRQAEAWNLITQLYYLDGGRNLRRELDGEPMLPLTEWIVSHSKEQTINESWRLNVARDTFRQQFTDHFRSLDLDVLLCPAAPGPAPLHGTSKYWSYTALFNLLDWPAAVFPTGRSVELKDKELDYHTRNPDEAAIYANYAPEKFVGAPLGLQLAAPRWDDEILMEALKVVNGVLPLVL